MRTKSLTVKVKYSVIAELAFVAYFANAAIRWAVNGVLGTGTIATWIGMLIPYALLGVCLMLNYRKAFKLDFLILYMLVLAFFGVSLLLHPDYAYYYERADFGVWDHVLRPYRGIYAILFIRLLDRPEQVIKGMKISGWVLYPYAVRRIVIALQRGYWDGFAMGGGEAVEMSYSVSFGYEILPFVLFFLLDALYYKNKLSIAGAAVGGFMILIAGSRGPFLFIAELVVIYLILELRNSRKKVIISLLVIIAGVILYLYGSLLVGLLAGALSKLGFSSRFLKRLLAGTITGDSGRSIIWEAALQMLKDNPLGYGAMGARQSLAPLVYVGYPHSIILEFMIDYGVFLGGAIIIFFGIYSYRLIFRSDNEWKLAFIPMFCSACGLLISLTYWSVPAYWACLGLGFHAYLSRRKGAERGKGV